MSLFQRPKTDLAKRELKELRRRELELERQRREMETVVRETPKRKREAMATMPPPDDLSDRRRENKFYAELATRGQVRNEIRAQTGSVFVLLFLVIALASLILWMIRLFQGA